MLFLDFCRRNYSGSYDKHLEYVGNRAHGDYKGAGGRLLQEYMGEEIVFLFCSGVGWQLYSFSAVFMRFYISIHGEYILSCSKQPLGPKQ